MSQLQQQTKPQASVSQFFTPVLHPAFSFRQPHALGPLQAHVTNFIANGLWGLPKPIRIHENPPASVLRSLLKRVAQSNEALAIDVESGEWGHLPGFAELRAVGVGVDSNGGEGLSWLWPLPQDIHSLLFKAFTAKALTKLFMNGTSYDIPVLQRYGFKFAGPLEDIREMRRALSSTSRVALGHQASIYLRCGPWKAEALEDEAKGLLDSAANITDSKLLTYNAEDCVRTAQIYKKQLVEAESEGPRVKKIYRQLRRLAEVASEMHLKGFPFDRERQKQLGEELTATARERALEFRKLAKGRGRIKISSRGGVNENDLRALIYRQCQKKGVKSFSLEVPMNEHCWTDSGAPAVNKRALLYLLAQDNTPDELKLIIRQAWKVDAPLKSRSTFVLSDLVEEAIGPDGRLHAGINSCGPETYRWSCRAPNLFNLPEAKLEDEGALQGDLPNVRALYVAPPGYVIVHGDFKQLELEVMAEYTGDKLLRKMLDTGDAHTARVREWFGVAPTAEVPKALRRQGKVVGFASQYGAGVDTVFLTVLEQLPDAKFEDVQQLWRTFRTKHVQIEGHWGSSVRYAEENGYSEAPIMDYRRYYPPGAPIKPTETSNYAIQGGAAAIANSTMVGDGSEESYRLSLHGRLKRECPKAWIALHTYDSFDIICPKRNVEKVKLLLTETAKGPWRIGAVPKEYLLDIKVGERLSDV